MVLLMFGISLFLVKNRLNLKIARPIQAILDECRWHTEAGSFNSYYTSHIKFNVSAIINYLYTSLTLSYFVAANIAVSYGTKSTGHV